MNLLSKKRTPFYLLIILSPYMLQAAKLVHQQGKQVQKDDITALSRAKRKQLVHGYCRSHNIPTDILLFVTYFVHDNPLQYKKKPLPHDLSGQDLSGFDFTGCAFTSTNLTDSDLTNVILTNTTCDYQKAFQENSKKNKLKGGSSYQQYLPSDFKSIAVVYTKMKKNHHKSKLLAVAAGLAWLQNNLPNDLQSIAQVYPKLNNHAHKAKLLAIAAGLAWLPFYEGTEFYIKVQYWSAELLQLKQVLDHPYGEQLICSLAWYLSSDANNYCWTTNYPQDRVNIAGKAPHANFATYLKHFTNGLSHYQCKSNDSWGFNWYKDNIIKNIQGLAVTYPHIKDEQLQQEACNIAHALSKMYQVRKSAFLNGYLLLQNRLIWLKKSLKVGGNNKVYYSYARGQFYPCLGWHSMTYENENT